jgi:VWFA-related protein
MIYALGFIDVQERSDGKPKITPPDPSLRQLADDTGGGYFELRDTADLTNLFTRVGEELHRQYRLAFVPPIRDGKVHLIQIRVTNKDLTVRARQSYVAPK